MLLQHTFDCGMCTDLGPQMFVQEDVPGAEVAVSDWRLALVQISQATSLCTYKDILQIEKSRSASNDGGEINETGIRMQVVSLVSLR